MITQRVHHFITRQNYLLLKTDVLRRGSNLQFIRSRSYAPLTIASMRIITKQITFFFECAAFLAAGKKGKK